MYMTISIALVSTAKHWHWIGHVYIGIIFLFIGNSNWCLCKTQLILIGCSTPSQEYCKLIGWSWKIMRRQLWTLTCLIIILICDFFLFRRKLGQSVHITWYNKNTSYLPSSDGDFTLDLYLDMCIHDTVQRLAEHLQCGVRNLQIYETKRLAHWTVLLDLSGSDQSSFFPPGNLEFPCI